MLPTMLYPRRAAAVLAAAWALAMAGPVHAQAGCADPVPEDQWSTIAPLATSAMMLDVAKAGDTFFAVGDRGYVVVSEDAGRSWTQQVTPTRSLLTAVWFADRQVGWAVGHDAVILRTTDGGDTWCRVHWAPELEQPLFDVWFADADNGIAIGAYGFFLRTDDGGDSWTQVTFEPGDLATEDAEDEAAGEGGDDQEWDEDFNLAGDFHLNKIIVAGDRRLFIAAEAGHLYRSRDAGRTWVELPSPYDGSFFSGIYLGGDSVMVFGLRGNVFRTDDAGRNWREIEVPSDRSLFGGGRLNDGSVLLLGSSGVMLVSREGDSFRLVQRPDRKMLMTFQPTTDDGLVVVGEPGVERIELSELAAP